MLSPAALAGALIVSRDVGVIKAKLPGADAAFGAVFVARLNAKAASGVAPAAGREDAAAATAGGGTTAERDAEAEIAQLVGEGKSESDVLDTWAAKLATSAAETLGLSGQDARAQLRAVFRSALVSPERPAGESLAGDRSRSLAQRFVRIKEPATLIAGQILGQQNRIAGNLLDAQPAKDIPAQTQTNESTATQPKAAPAATTASDNADGRAKSALAAKITSLLEAGVSQAQIVATILAEGAAALKETVPPTNRDTARSAQPASPFPGAPVADHAAPPPVVIHVRDVRGAHNGTLTAPSAVNADAAAAALASKKA